MTNNERRQTGGRVDGSDFSDKQQSKDLKKEKEVEVKAESPEESNSFGNTVKFTKPSPFYKT